MPARHQGGGELGVGWHQSCATLSSTLLLRLLLVLPQLKHQLLNKQAECHGRMRGREKEVYASPEKRRDSGGVGRKER